MPMHGTTRHGINRRHFFFGSLALTLGCSPKARVRAAAKVSILRIPSYSAELVAPLRQILVDHRVAIHGRNILLKPNLVEFANDRPINTNPIFVAAAAEAFRSLGALSVQIAEGPGHRRMTLDMAEAAGFFSAIPNFEDRFTDLNLDDVSRIPLRNPFSSLRELFLPKTALGCDLLVTMPKMKTHHWTGATLSMKNLFGLVPGSIYGWPKNPLHWAGIDQSVADLHSLFPQQFCLVDGIEAMEGNGPILGTSKHMGLIIAGAHPPSVDAACCRVMRVDPTKVGYLQLVAKHSPFNIDEPLQLGESIQSVASPFALHPDLKHMRLAV
jgi:uncharacterized protein (DUF362 family)